MELQKFVTTSIEAMGGIVECIEYGLCNILVPDNFTGMFHGRNELRLAFDYEVAQENPESEFVTFGSYILNKIFEIIARETVSSIRYAVVDKLSLSNAEEKIKKHLCLLRGSIKIISERPVLDFIPVYTFRVGYISDERTEDFVEIWIDMLTMSVSEKMSRSSAGIFYEDEPIYNFPIAILPDIQTSFEMAFEQVKKEAEIGALHHTRNNEMVKDITRVTSYYSELIQENEKRKTRKGLSEEHIEEITEKTELLELDKNKQIIEMQNKYKVKTDISLDHVILYEIPHIEYKIKVNLPGNEYESMLYYNPILKSFTETKYR